MDYLAYFKRLEYLLELLEKGQITSSKTITKKFDCCDKTARNMINKLREQGIEINYCKSSNKYVIKHISDGK